MSFNMRPRSWRNCRTRSPKGVIRSSPRTPPPAEPDIECTGSAMLGRSLLEADHQMAQVGQAQPMRHHAAQDAPFFEQALAHGSATLAGDHQDEGMAGALRAMQEAQEGKMRLLLAHPVQVDDA